MGERVVTMKRIDKDERSFYEIGHDYDETVEFTDAELARIEAAFSEFEAVQRILRARWEEANS